MLVLICVTFHWQVDLNFLEGYEIKEFSSLSQSTKKQFFWPHGQALSHSLWMSSPPTHVVYLRPYIFCYAHSRVNTVQSHPLAQALVLEKIPLKHVCHVLVNHEKEIWGRILTTLWSNSLGALLSRVTSFFSPFQISVCRQIWRSVAHCVWTEGLLGGTVPHFFSDVFIISDQ